MKFIVHNGSTRSFPCCFVTSITLKRLTTCMDTSREIRFCERSRYGFADAIRPEDAVGRYGGEEFLVVLGNCGAESLRRRAEQLRQIIASSSFTGALQSLSISISIGAMTIDCWTNDQTPELCLSQIDTALYRAKMEGRNRVAIAAPQPLATLASPEHHQTFARIMYGPC